MAAATAGAALRPLLAASVGRRPHRAPRPGAADEYTLSAEVTYLNHAAIGTMPRVLQEQRAGYLATLEENPWLYLWGGGWDAARERTRAAMAALLGATAEELAITHNTTEGFNLLASGLPLAGPRAVAFSGLNHPGASVAFRHWGGRRGYSVHDIPLAYDRAAAMDDAELVAAHCDGLDERTQLLVLPHLDNAIGRRHPLPELVAAARRRGVRWVAVDGAQTVGMVDVDVRAAGVDFYATSPHKWLQAPKGLGALYVANRVLDVLQPMWVTWGQEPWAGTARLFEDYGTRNLPEVLVLGDAALRMRTLAAGDRDEHLGGLWQRLRDGTAARPHLRWEAPADWERGGALVAIGVRGRDSREVADRLWQERGIVTRAFHSEGLDALRVSPGLPTTAKDVDALFTALDQMRG